MLNCPQSVNVPFYLASPENLPDCVLASMALPMVPDAENKTGRWVEGDTISSVLGTVVIFKGSRLQSADLFYQSPMGSGNLPSYRWLAETGINYYIGMYSDDLFYPGELNFDVNCLTAHPEILVVGVVVNRRRICYNHPAWQQIPSGVVNGLPPWRVVPMAGWWQNIVLTNTSAYVLDIKLLQVNVAHYNVFYQQSLHQEINGNKNPGK